MIGGSRGIGQASALLLAKLGYQVWVAGRSDESLGLVCAQAPERLLPLVLDVCDPLSVSAAIKQLDPHKLDVFVYAAGIGAYSDIRSSEDPDLWNKVIATNLNGAYTCLREALSYINSPGRIILISSVLGLRGMRHSHAYCASKHGLIGLTRALALDLAPQGITVNAICPGWVETQMAKKDMQNMASFWRLDPGEVEHAEIDAVPIGRWIQASEVAELMAYLVSPVAAALTGQAIEINGGL